MPGLPSLASARLCIPDRRAGVFLQQMSVSSHSQLQFTDLSPGGIVMLSL